MPIPPHYAPIVRAGNLLFTSGQLPLLSRNPLRVPPSLHEQAQLVLERIEDMLKDYNLDRMAIIKTTAFITNIEEWDVVNEVYASFFGSHKPARSVIPVHSLHFGCQIELEAIAVISG